MQHQRGTTDRQSASSRPVAVPDDLDEDSFDKADGIIELPAHIRWSGPPRSYDLAKRRERARVYEQVLREGSEDDVRRFVRVDDLIDLWPDLFLPDRVRTAWERWFKSHGRSVPC